MTTRIFLLLYSFAQVLFAEIPFSIELYSLLINFIELVITYIDFVGGNNMKIIVAVTVVGFNMVDTTNDENPDEINPE